MHKALFAAGLAALAASAAIAQTKERLMECSEPGLSQLWNSVDTIRDTQKRSDAMKGWARAMAMYDRQDMAGCRNHMVDAYGMYDAANDYFQRP